MLKYLILFLVFGLVGCSTEVTTYETIAEIITLPSTVVLSDDGKSIKRLDGHSVSIGFKASVGGKALIETDRLLNKQILYIFHNYPSRKFPVTLELRQSGRFCG